MDYYLNELVESYKRDLARDKTILEAWEKVTYPTKKDGTPFANMAKNFDGACFCYTDYASYAYEKRLFVSGYSKIRGYVNDSVYCYDNGGINDLETIKAKVTKQINHLKGRITEYELKIANIEKAYNKAKADFECIYETLKATPGIDKYSATSIMEVVLKEVRYS